MDDLGVLGRSRSSFELVGAPEELDQLARHIRLAGVPMIREPAAVGRREPPRVALVEVREDLAGAAIEAAVLCPKDGDLVRARDVTQLGPVVRPGLDLARDELDPELR